MHQYSIFPSQEASKRAVPTIEALNTTLNTYLAPDQVRQVDRAFFYAEQAHTGQRRRSGEAYVTHPLSVAAILADMHMDHQSLMAAMLHDVIEDTGIGKEALEKQFGEVVAELVDGVSKLTQIEFQSRAEAQAENFQKMALAMARDIRVILVKLADRLHNMRTLGVLPPEKRRRIARETLEIYAPIAQRLGMHKLRVEFEDLGFQALHPMRSERIARAVKVATGNRKELFNKIRRSIELCLEREGHQARVLGRKKHLYGIYRKMRSKRKSFADIMDLYAYRIIVDSVDTCYRVLGCMHSLYKPVPGQFKDYIAIPKANGYQSLHTVLFGMHGVPVEVQIRTEEMEDMANNGIAAHWLYKSNGDSPITGSQARARRWIQGLLEMQQRAGDSLEFIENVKIDLFPDEIYVFTPRGDILELPQGSTPVDFAYAVHTGVGNHTVACRINRQLAPLSEPLQSGQTVEVITTPGAQPNPAWLNFVVTAKARTNVRHALKQQRRTEAKTLGKRLLDKALNTLGSSIDRLTDEQKAHVVSQMDVEHFDAILEEIGLGNRVAIITARQLLSEAGTGGRDTAQLAKAQEAMAIRGTEGFLVKYAKCCYPLPGDPIVGIISSEKGMVIHTASCHNSVDVRVKPERLINLHWHDDVDGDFAVELRVEMQKSRGAIAMLATKITSVDANIKRINVNDDDPSVSAVNLVLLARSRVHLAQIMRRIRAMAGITKVIRVKH